MPGKPRIYLFSPTRLINSMNHEHSCKILYIHNSRPADVSSVLTVSVSSNGSDEATHPLSFAGVLHVLFMSHLTIFQLRRVGVPGLNLC